MVKTKYGHLIKSFSFKDNGPGSCRQGTEMNGEFLGYDLNIQYGAYWSAGRIGPDNNAEKHDFDQVMVFMGTDTYDMGYLGAEVEFYIGKEKEIHMITTATAVAIPKGTPHLPANIGRMDDRFILMTISLAPELKATPVTLDDKPGQQAAFMRSIYRENVQHLAFTRNGPWHYGPLNQDTHEGAITDIRGKRAEVGWQLIEDPVINRGGCRVVTDTSQVDASLESRLASLIAPLLAGARAIDEQLEEE